MRRSVHRLLLSFGSIAAALTLIIGFSLWRLMLGPIELDRLTPYVEEAFNRSTDGLRIAISGVRLTIDRYDRRLDLQLEGARLAHPDGELLATFSEMSASFSLGALLRANLMPSRLVVEHPVLRFIRDRRGKIEIGFGSQNTNGSSLGPEILERAAGAPDPVASFGLMPEVVIRDATLRLVDVQTGRRWQADGVDATIERDGEDLTGDLSTSLGVGARAARLQRGIATPPLARRLIWLWRLAPSNPPLLLRYSRSWCLWLPSISRFREHSRHGS